MQKSDLARKRLTKIICTLGPASWEVEQIEALAKAGMNIARINVSHGQADEHKTVIDRIRKVNEKGYSIGIMIDTKGAEIRTNQRVDKLIVKKDEKILFSPHPIENSLFPVVTVNYDGFADDVRETKSILVDNGELSFSIVEIRDDGSVLAQAEGDGTIGSKRHINLPGADIDLPSITTHDWEDIAFAAREHVDFIALSFVRTAEDIIAVKTFLENEGVDIFLIAKIETKAAVENLPSILDVADGIMVARGDLGADLPFEDIPLIQHEAVSLCRDAGKPVIVATHMLESMIVHPIPTRAEVTDVAHAAESKVDATMLSGETAGGKYPQKSVEAMDRILRATESYINRLADEDALIHDDREAQAQSVVELAESSEADAIVVFTRSGRTARIVSKFRAEVPVFAVTDSPEVQKKLQLFYGIFPEVLKFSSPEETVTAALDMLVEKGHLQKRQSVVLVSDTQGTSEPISSIQVREIE